jgi:hypothetical protein
VYVAVPPGATVDELEFEQVGMFKPKSFTCSLTATLGAVRKFESPEYTAVIECVPSASALTGSDATPLTSVTVPSGVEEEESRNVTEPVGRACRRTHGRRERHRVLNKNRVRARGKHNARRGLVHD